MKLTSLLLIISALFIKPSFADSESIIKKIDNASDQEISELSKLVSEKLSESLPQKIDSTTTFTSTIYNPITNSFIYNYESSIKIDENNAKSYIIPHMCNDPIKKAFLDRGMTYIHIYNLPESTLTVKVTADDCGQTTNKKTKINSYSTSDKLENGLINALTLNNNTRERAYDSGKAIQAYMKKGIIKNKPDQRADYTDYYIVNKPTKFMGHDLVVIEEEYMTQYIGCCVSPGAGVSVKVDGNADNLKAFAKENGCSLTENVNLSEELDNVGIKAKLSKGEYVTLSCRERDVDN